jgi:hypothetical protein
MEIIVSKRSGNVLVYIPELKKRISLDSSTFLWFDGNFCHNEIVDHIEHNFKIDITNVIYL